MSARDFEAVRDSLFEYDGAAWFLPKQPFSLGLVSSYIHRPLLSRSVVSPLDAVLPIIVERFLFGLARQLVILHPTNLCANNSFKGLVEENCSTKTPYSVTLQHSWEQPRVI